MPSTDTGSVDAKRSVITGTPGYMSPDRPLGHAAIGAYDIWSFGCLHYECLVGTLPFRGATVRQVVLDTIHGEPRLDELPGSMPTAVRARSAA